MTQHLRKNVNFKANIEALVDGYKITIALHNIVNFYSITNEKKIQQWQATIKSLSKASYLK